MTYLCFLASVENMSAAIFPLRKTKGNGDGYLWEGNLRVPGMFPGTKGMNLSLPTGIITSFGKIQLVVYYQCYVLIG